jgi:3',5'-cyclic AMP phosphodiesterase CpdA
MYVLAHLSDPHLGPLPVPRFRELASKRAIGFLNWSRSRRRRHRTEALAVLVDDLKAAGPDHVALTGDLVNIALAAEFAPAGEWLARLGTPTDVSLVPGNHDTYVRQIVDHAGRHWGDYMRGDADANPWGGFPFLRRRGPLAIVGLSTAVPTAPFLATGRLGGEQLARFAELMIRLEREGLFRVVLIHHPPTRGHARHKRLVDALLFRALLAEHGADLVLHGHHHTHTMVWLQGPHGPIPVVGVPSASAAPGGDMEPAAYNLYRVSGSPGAWTCEAVSRSLRYDQEGVGEIRRWKIFENGVPA